MIVDLETRDGQPLAAQRLFNSEGVLRDLRCCIDKDMRAWRKSSLTHFGQARENRRGRGHPESAI